VKCIALLLCAFGLLTAVEREGNFQIRFEPSAKLQTGVLFPALGVEVEVSDCAGRLFTVAVSVVPDRASKLSCVDCPTLTLETSACAMSAWATRALGSATVAIAPGDVVELYREGSTLRAQTSRGVSLGEVDTKIARRLVPLMETGNRYSAAVARVEDERIELIVREIFQAPENARRSSFPVSRTARRDDFRPYAKDSLLSERGVDDEVFGDGDDDGVPPSTATTDSEDLVGMQELDDEFEPAVAAGTEEEGDVDDEEGRPEDHY